MFKPFWWQDVAQSPDLIPISLICPVDKSALMREVDGFACPKCRRNYPSIMDMPSFIPTDSIKPDEMSLVRQLIGIYAMVSADEMAVRRLNTVELTDAQRRRYTHYTRELAARGHRFHRMFQRRLAEHGWPAPDHRLALDIGCGVGAGLTPLAQEYDHVIGIDIRLSSLIIARKMIDEAGLRNVTLIHASALSMPLPDAAFDYAASINVLEHVFRPSDLLRETRRVLANGGVFCGDSRNRFDLLFKEPHVQLRWVGFLPRSWMSRYVQWRTGDKYDYAYLLSYRELRRSLAAVFGAHWRIAFPEAEAYGVSGRAGKALNIIERTPLLSPAVKLIGPTHIALARRVTGNQAQ
jgi:ubiquinone/menaquinone biosynthesis C-methylase UbiE